MYRKQPSQQETCFIPGSLSDYIPEDHILKCVKAVLDLSWLGEEVKGLYAEANGRPCIDPERALRLMLAGFFHGVVHDRKLMREAQVNIAYRCNEGKELLSQLERVAESVYGELPQGVTADSGYASSSNYAALEELKVAAVIPPQADKTPHRGLPLRRFAYDAHHDVVRCPAGKVLTRRSRGQNGWMYRARAADCKACALRKRCVAPTARVRYDALAHHECVH